MQLMKMYIFKVFFVFCIHLTFTSKGYTFTTGDSPAASQDGEKSTPLDMISKHGYPEETHIVQTEDGYILTLHRIPRGKAASNDKTGYPTLLHHGLLGSSMEWLINGPEKSLGYRLADEGFDVWMANARGNTYSRNHIRYDSQQTEFWDFSFHEIGIYDLPATIDYILSNTNREQLIYMGFSLGTTVFYVMASSLPQYNDKVKFQISLAPISAIPHTTSAFKLLLPFIDKLNELSPTGSILEHDTIIEIIAENICGINFGNTSICVQLIISQLFGSDPQQFNSSLINEIVKFFPAGTSIKNAIHCSQLMKSSTFRQYDYGMWGNLFNYASFVPPDYEIETIQVPIRAYYGENDLLANPQDTEILYRRFSHPLGLIKINYEQFSHVDFIFCIDVNRLLNDELITFIKTRTDS